jgi:hypothetical protein
MPRIPFISTPDKALTSSTQDFIPIADIVDGVVIYKNGGAALVMESTSLNFGLLSQIEQEAVIAAYAGLLNSFNFPVQIVVRSQKKDITNYMRFLSQAEKKINNPQLAGLMKGYKEFIKEAIKKKNVLSKKFYIVIPFTPYELGVAKSMSAFLNPSKSAVLPFPKSYVTRKAKIALFPKRDHLMRQAGRLGIMFKPLSNDELIQLMYDIYNPEKPVKDSGGLL